MVEGDAKRVRDAVKFSATANTVFGDYIDSIRAMLNLHPLYSISWVSRNANIVAHAFARNSRVFENPHTWVEPPSFVEGLLEEVCNSCV